MANAATIFGRIWIVDDGYQDYQFWHYDLDPTDGKRCSIEEWAEIHFTNCYSAEDLREIFGLPKEGDFQVVFKGTLEGSYDEWTGEADEWFDLEEVKFVSIPENWTWYKRDILEKDILNPPLSDQ